MNYNLSFALVVSIFLSELLDKSERCFIQHKSYGHCFLKFGRLSSFVMFVMTIKMGISHCCRQKDYDQFRSFSSCLYKYNFILRKTKTKINVLVLFYTHFLLLSSVDITVPWHMISKCTNMC